MSLTQHAIAKQLGISQAAVSQALRGTGNMSASVREKILSEAIRMGYRPNPSARAIRSGRFGSISLLLSTVYQHSFLPYELIPGMLAEARRQSTQLTIVGCPDQELVDKDFVREALRRWSSDGLLINYTHNFPTKVTDLIQSYKMPSVWVNAKFETDCAHPDDLGATTLATNKLIELGHRKIGYIDLTRTSHYSVRDRYDGYAAAMHAHQLRLNPFTLEIPRAQRYPAIRAWLAAPDHPTAVVTYEDREANPLFAAAMSLNLRVPEDLSIVTIHDYPADGSGVAFATVQHDFHSLGVESVKMLMKKIRTPSQKIPSKKISPKWLPGATLAPPPTPVAA